MSDITVAERFQGFLTNWDWFQYLLLGGYGSGKSYSIALKLIIKCLQEKRRVLVCRAVYETLRDSCYSIIRDVAERLGLLGGKNAVCQTTVNPFEIRFNNGSVILFRGLDKPERLKSIHGVSIIWLEEAPEASFMSYEELLGRIRQKDVSNHIILSCNPVGRESWIYKVFFERWGGKKFEELFYEKGTFVKNNTYYHHSIVDDNPFVPPSYAEHLTELKDIDPQLYEVARWGRFGSTGSRVLPQFEARPEIEVLSKVREIPDQYKFTGFDFGFETSFNAVVQVAVDNTDPLRQVLYIYNEIYVNRVTDDKFQSLPEMQFLKNRHILITADSAEPKSIQYYRQQGFYIKGCKKFSGSRLANTRKVKRFAHIYCSKGCPNTIAELQDLTYKKDGKGAVIFDEFNIDPHTFSAIWYALDNYNVTSGAEKVYNTYGERPNKYVLDFPAAAAKGA